MERRTARFLKHFDGTHTRFRKYEARMTESTAALTTLGTTRNDREQIITSYTERPYHSPVDALFLIANILSPSTAVIFSIVDI